MAEVALTSGARLPALRSPAAIVGGVKARDLQGAGPSAAERRRESGGWQTESASIGRGQQDGEPLSRGDELDESLGHRTDAHDELAGVLELGDGETEDVVEVTSVVVTTGDPTSSVGARAR